MKSPLATAQRFLVTIGPIGEPPDALPKRLKRKSVFPLTAAPLSFSLPRYPNVSASELCPAADSAGTSMHPITITSFRIVNMSERMVGFPHEVRVFRPMPAFMASDFPIDRPCPTTNVRLPRRFRRAYNRKLLAQPE